MLDVQQALLYAQSPASYMPPNWPLVSLDTPELRAAVAVGPDRPANTPPSQPPPSDPGTGGGAMSAAALLWTAGGRVGPARAAQRKVGAHGAKPAP